MREKQAAARREKRRGPRRLWLAVLAALIAAVCGGWAGTGYAEDTQEVTVVAVTPYGSASSGSGVDMASALQSLDGKIEEAICLRIAGTLIEEDFSALNDFMKEYSDLKKVDLIGADLADGALPDGTFAGTSLKLLMIPGPTPPGIGDGAFADLSGRPGPGADTRIDTGTDSVGSGVGSIFGRTHDYRRRDSSRRALLRRGFLGHTGHILPPAPDRQRHNADRDKHSLPEKRSTTG